MSVAELLANAKQLEAKNFEKFYRNLTAIRIQRHGIPVLDQTESALLAIINREFDPEKWERLQYLDWKMEFGALTETEENELLMLTETYENHSVERLKALTQLALIRQVTVDQLMSQLGLNS